MKNPAEELTGQRTARLFGGKIFPYNFMRELIQCLQLSNQTITEKQTIAALKNAGFNGAFVQWYNDSTVEYKTELVKACRAAGLKVPFAHLGYDRINEIWKTDGAGDDVLNGFIRDLQKLSDLGVPKALVHLSSGFQPPEMSEIGLDRYEKLCSEAKKLGMRILFENNKLKGYLEYVFDRLNADNTGICLDVGHCHAHFKDDFPWGTLGGKIEELHLHDNDGSSDQHLLPFDGGVPWEFYIRKLKECGYGGAVTLESRYYERYLGESADEFYKTAFARAVTIRAAFEK